MLTESASWTGDDVGVFSALLIALAGGWAASRMVRVHPDPFGCLVLGVTGPICTLCEHGNVKPEAVMGFPLWTRGGRRFRKPS